MNCPFCKLVRDAEDKTFVYKFDQGKVYLNKNQFFYGRIMYVLNEHWTDISEVPLAVFEKTMINIHRLTQVIKTAMNADLINVASLGNHVNHVHWHIIPRYKHDLCWGNPPWPHGELILPTDEMKELKKRIIKAIESYNVENIL